MALSQRDLLRRIKQQGSSKVGTTSQTRSSPVKVVLESDLETTQSDPKAKRKRIESKKGAPTRSETSESRDRPPSAEKVLLGQSPLLTSNKSFWGEDFDHASHGRNCNYSAVDASLLAARASSFLHEDLLRGLHQAEAASIQLADRLTMAEQREVRAKTDLELAEKEVPQLKSDIDLARKRYLHLSLTLQTWRNFASLLRIKILRLLISRTSLTS